MSMFLFMGYELLKMGHVGPNIEGQKTETGWNRLVEEPPETGRGNGYWLGDNAQLFGGEQVAGGAQLERERGDRGQTEREPPPGK